MITIQDLEESCYFQTERLSVAKWSEELFTPTGIATTTSILSKEVTATLPEGWQNLSTEPEVTEWLQERINESCFLTIKQEETQLIGFLLLYPDQREEKTTLHLGYLLGKRFWGKGYATELINGLVSWCSSNGKISAISGGVSSDNEASGKVLEKNGFIKAQNTLPDTITYERIFQ